jgi:hypothetical protein
MKIKSLLTGFSIALFLSSAQLKAQEQTQSLSFPVDSKPLYILSDGKQERTFTSFNLQEIQKDQVDSLRVISDPQFLTQYGEKGKNGVVMLYVKEHYYKEFIKNKE